MTQARRATKQTPQQAPQHAAPGYPQQVPPHASGYPQPYPQAAQQASGYPPPAQYPYPQQSGYPQAPSYPPPQMQPNYGYGHASQAPQHQAYAQQQAAYAQQQYAQQQYAQQQYAQQQYAQQQQLAQQQYAQHQHAQHQQPYAQPSYPPPQAYPQAQPQAQRPDPRDYRVHESGVHPADHEDRTILRPSFGPGPMAAPMASAPVAAPLQARGGNVGNPQHNDTVVAVSPFVDAFSASRLQAKSDVRDLREREAETRIQEVDPNLFNSTMNATLSSPPGYPQMPQQIAPAPTAAAAPAPVRAAPVQSPAAFQPTVAASAVPMMSPTPAPVAAPAAAPAKAKAKEPVGKEPMAKTTKTPKPATAAKPAIGGVALPSMPKLGVHGVGNVDLSKMNKYAGRFGGGMAIVFMLAAVALATAFDVLFLKLPLGSLPFGHYIGRLWYLTTALSFAGAGFGAALMTRASKGLVITMGVIVAVLYGAADIGLQSVLEGLSFGSAIFLAAQGVAIALICGVGAAIKGFAQRP